MKPKYVEFARCQECDWQPQEKSKRNFDSQAASHTKSTGHSTVSGLRHAKSNRG